MTLTSFEGRPHYAATGHPKAESASPTRLVEVAKPRHGHSLSVPSFALAHQTGKPRIKLVGTWQCYGTRCGISASGTGSTPFWAYKDWESKINLGFANCTITQPVLYSGNYNANEP